MATVSKIFYQGVLGTAAATLTGTVPASGHTYLITHIHLNNYSGLTATVKADIAPYYVEFFSQLKIGPHETYDWYPRDFLVNAGEGLEAWASAASSVLCIISGKDIT